jgi:hypothetical protein
VLSGGYIIFEVPSANYEDYCFLGYEAVKAGRNLLSFWKNLLPPYSEMKAADFSKTLVNL